MPKVNIVLVNKYNNVGPKEALLLNYPQQVYNIWQLCLPTLKNSRDIESNSSAFNREDEFDTISLFNTLQSHPLFQQRYSLKC